MDRIALLQSTWSRKLGCDLRSDRCRSFFFELGLFWPFEFLNSLVGLLIDCVGSNVFASGHIQSRGYAVFANGLKIRYVVNLFRSFKLTLVATHSHVPVSRTSTLWMLRMTIPNEWIIFARLLAANGAKKKLVYFGIEQKIFLTGNLNNFGNFKTN